MRRVQENLRKKEVVASTENFMHSLPKTRLSHQLSNWPGINPSPEIQCIITCNILWCSCNIITQGKQARFGIVDSLWTTVYVLTRCINLFSSQGRLRVKYKVRHNFHLMHPIKPEHSDNKKGRSRAATPINGVPSTKHWVLPSFCPFPCKPSSDCPVFFQWHIWRWSHL